MRTDLFVPAADIERETSFGSDQLRKWRQRYGFPLLDASPKSVAGYSAETVSQLLSIRRLLEGGFRAGQVVGKPPMELARLQRSLADVVSEPGWSEANLKLIERVKRPDVAGLRALLAKARATGTLTEFVLNTIVPLLRGLNALWEQGEIGIYHERLCSSVIERCLHAEIVSRKPKRGYPTILFATPPDEKHVLGLLIAEAVLADQGARTISMGSHAPFSDVEEAVTACDADVFALSFSFAFPPRRVLPTLLHFRTLIPARVEIWAGGTGLAMVRQPPKGVRVFSEIHEAVVVLQDLSRKKHQ